MSPQNLSTARGAALYIGAILGPGRPALRKGQQPAGSHLQRPAHPDTNRLTSSGPTMISVTRKNDAHPWLTLGLVICKFYLTGEREWTDTCS